MFKKLTLGHSFQKYHWKLLPVSGVIICRGDSLLNAIPHKQPYMIGNCFGVMCWTFPKGKETLMTTGLPAISLSCYFSHRLWVIFKSEREYRRILENIGDLAKNGLKGLYQIWCVWEMGSYRQNISSAARKVL